jgi:hypothetical protein
MAKISVQQTDINILTYREQDYISHTDKANVKESEFLSLTYMLQLKDGEFATN